MVPWQCWLGIIKPKGVSKMVENTSDMLLQMKYFYSVEFFAD